MVCRSREWPSEAGFGGLRVDELATAPGKDGRVVRVRGDMRGGMLYHAECCYRLTRNNIYLMHRKLLEELAEMAFSRQTPTGYFNYLLLWR